MTKTKTPIVESVVVSRNNATLFAHIAPLYFPDDAIIMDVTYGRGSFWKQFHPSNLIKHDLIVDGVDCRRLPEVDGSVDVIVFDPPYMPDSCGHRSTLNGDFTNRYGLENNGGRSLSNGALVDLVAETTKEARRVLKPGGLLMLKCQDFIQSGKFVAMRQRLVGLVTSLDFEQVDEIILVRGRGPQPEGRQQVHSRRVHSFLLIFRKCK